jgi:glycosyltransferase involved in cell wall biosynthesis
MNICMVLADRDFPPDIRVEKEARSLISAGHRVFLLCPRTSDRPPVETWNGIEIRRFSGPVFVPLRKLNSLMFWCFLRDLQWEKAILELIEERGVNALHVHDLPMVGTALSAANRHGLPVIADLHEHYPARRSLPPTGTRRRIAEHIISPRRWQRAERRWGRRSAAVIAVVDEMKERLAEDGIPAEKIIVVENTVDLEHFLSLPIDEKLVLRYKDDFVISYVGHFSHRRGLDIAIKAMPRILRGIPNAKLLLVGYGPVKDSLKDLAAKMGLKDRVIFTGKVDFAKVPTYITLSQVCILPLRSTVQTEACAPNKLFDCMALGKAVVVSSCRSLRRFVEDGRLGLVFEAGDSNALAVAILKLKDPGVRKKVGDAGKEAAFEKYNWRTASQRLLQLYQLLSSHVVG